MFQMDSCDRQQRQRDSRPPGNLEQHMLQSGFSMSDVKGKRIICLLFGSHVYWLELDLSSGHNTSAQKIDFYLISSFCTPLIRYASVPVVLYTNVKHADLQRAYSEDAAEGPGSDSPVLPKGPPPRRKSIRSGTLTKTASFEHATLGIPGVADKSGSEHSMVPSMSELELRAKGQDPHDKKARGKSPFKFFSRNKDIPTMEPAPPTSLSPPPTVTIREPSIRGPSPCTVNGLLCFCFGVPQSIEVTACYLSSLIPELISFG